MSDEKQLQWWVDAREVDLVWEYLRENSVADRDYFRFFVMDAMEEYIDHDLGSELKSKIGTLDELLSDNIAGYSRRRRNSEDDTEPLVADNFGSGETKKIRCDVRADLFERFKSYIDGLETDYGYGEALGRALNAYRGGGRHRRLIDRVTRIIDALGGMSDIEQADDTESDDESNDESDSESKPYSREEKLQAIRQDIADANNKASAAEISQFPRSQLLESIHEHCSQEPGKNASDRTVSSYIKEFKEDLGFVDHPKNDVLLIKDDEIDCLPFENKDYDALTTAERVEAVRVKLLREADSGTRYQISAADIKREYFDGEPSDSVAHDLRERAADADGFGVRKARDGKKKLKVDPYEVTDETILEAAGVLEKVEGKREMDALDQAQREQQRQQYARTDGGTDI